MKAARLLPNAISLAIEDISLPMLRPGTAIVRVQSALGSHFLSKIVDGSGGYLVPPRPFTPGMDAIGIVEDVAEDVVGLTIGETVFCDCYYEPQQFTAVRERAFLGNFALGAQSLPLLARWPDGVYAEQICLPAECFIPIRPDPGLSPDVLCRLGWLGTAYAGLKKGRMVPGAVVAINGASGILGSSAVVVALGMGASRVYAVGRRREALEALASLDKRVVALTELTALEPVDVALSSIDGTDSSSLDALLLRVKRYGSLVCIGAPKAPLSANIGFVMANDITIRGSLWFNRADLGEILSMAKAGTMPLSSLSAETFPLNKINDALAAASLQRPNPLHHVAISIF